MSLIGYARVSTTEGRQVLDRQLDPLKDFGCERIFEDRASGSDPGQPQLAICLDYLRGGDVLVVRDLDLLHRRAAELITLIDELEQKRIGFQALNSPMDTEGKGEASAVMVAMIVTISDPVRLPLTRVPHEKTLLFAPLVPSAETISAPHARSLPTSTPWPHYDAASSATASTTSGVDE